jgi:malto-oligosyltrehalose trehalohydrolase
MTAAVRRFGPLLTADGVTFGLWAPTARKVELLADTAHNMRATECGWFEATISGAAPGTRYRFRIDDELVVPDPASRFQPDDVSGESEVIDSAFEWRATGWKGRPWHECVLLELHVGTFTRNGTYRAAIDWLDHFVDTGITAIELMPLSDFPGRWNWGYDGVLPFAPDSAYGGPQDLKALIDAAHQRGLMVFLDVVYNHFGPEGNFLGRYAPQFFVEAQTPWGSAIDYRVPEVRAFVIENALLWLDEYRFDGLRLDAVHAIVKPGTPSILTELSQAVGRLATASGRHIHLVLENDDNLASLLDPREDPPNGKYRAQWNDDYHHAWHVLLTGEATGYYRDYRDAAHHLARSLAEGFSYQGEASVHRSGKRRGEPTTKLPATAFINFLQNHDQIGNRAHGDRLSRLAAPTALEAALTVTALSPGIPLFFMGEEWGTRQPFPFFCDFTGELAQAVREGRRREFADASEHATLAVPDPMDEHTVRLATLDGETRRSSPHRERLELIKRLLAVRRSSIVPLLPTLEAGASQAGVQDDVLIARWRFRRGKSLTLVVNLSDRPRPSPMLAGSMDWIWGGMPGADIVPWGVHVGFGGG